LAGCGVGAAGAGSGVTGTTVRSATGEQLQARSTAGLLAGFDRVHKGIFAKMDSNKDNAIDEYESAPSMTLKDFQRADLNLTGKIEYRELVMFATDNGWKGYIPGFGKYDTADKFAGRFRHYLADRFDRLDLNNDGFLKNYEISNRDLQRTELGLNYPELRLKVRLTAVSDEEFKAGDKTADGKLSPAEFEDMYIDLVVAALSPPATPAKVNGGAGKPPSIGPGK
jgi:Ca2+-binding EF-hand superfamily protein